MSESFDVESLLREVLEVLQKHNIPIETASLNVSLLDAAFDEHFPQLKTYYVCEMGSYDMRQQRHRVNSPMTRMTPHIFSSGHRPMRPNGRRRRGAV